MIDLDSFPTDPGVYLMKNDKEEIIYIGKAINLKKRIKQYFLKDADKRFQVELLKKQISKIDFIVVNSEKEALILENNLIKKYQPKYNILLKDDKTFVSLKVSTHRYPKISIVRLKEKKKNDKSIYFGPYTDTQAAKKTLDLVLKLFPLRRCSDSEFTNRKRPCILFEMHKCMAPCTNLCSEKEYSQMVENTIQFLKGKNKILLKDLIKERERLSENLQFEKAKLIHELILKIEHVLQFQSVENISDKSMDVIAAKKDHSTIIIIKMIYRQGKLTGSENYTFHNIASTLEETVESFILQNYETNISSPIQLVVPFNLKRKNELSQLLNFDITHPLKGIKKKLLTTASTNLEALFSQQKRKESLLEKQLLQLQVTCNLNNFPKKIICFDISNFSGYLPVASMISFLDGKEDKKNYRLFKIPESIKGDCPAMAFVLKKQLLKMKENNCLPDLMIVDGGIAQLNTLIKTMEDLNIATIDMLALSKEEARHDKGLTQEKILLSNEKKPLILDRKSPILFLLQKIRDEAHRFAISFQQKQTHKRIDSTLSNIPGIGKVKKQKLLTHFKSISQIKKATKEELQKEPYLNDKDVQAILDFFSLIDFKM
ncbi:MAG TPA: excinuclease ABC subunit UvrC [Chlamydiales bacterium]|nr:excinuclease ABC subunit UvrC [Chlamydiales bacterium]